MYFIFLRPSLQFYEHGLQYKGQLHVSIEFSVAWNHAVRLLLSKCTRQMYGGDVWRGRNVPGMLFEQ
jgi:hypothetical protein